MDTLASMLYGGIYTSTYEEMSDGGPKCANEMTNAYRLSVTTFSVISNLILVKILYPAVAKAKEFQIAMGAQPHICEKLVGIACIMTEIWQTGLKFYTQRGIFMLNPCHIVVVVYAIILLTPKTRVTTFMYICISRWLYGTYLALIFPSLEGLDLFSEELLFFFEHYMGTFIAPIVVIMFGRYGNEDWRGYFKIQYFAFISHIFWQRVQQLAYSQLVLTPISYLTLANLNFTLCKSKSDPFVPYLDTWYLLFSEYYLNMLSVKFYCITIGLGKIARYFVQMMRGKEKL